MSKLMDKLIAGKLAWREKMASLPYEEKLIIVEKLRDAALLIKASKNIPSKRKTKFTVLKIDVS